MNHTKEPLAGFSPLYLHRFTGGSQLKGDGDTSNAIVRLILTTSQQLPKQKKVSGAHASS